MFPDKIPVVPGMAVRHDPEGGLAYRVDKVTASTDDYETKHALNGLRRVTYTQLEDGDFPAGTEWNRDESQFRANFTPLEETEQVSAEDLDLLVAFLETAYADTYPNDRGITRDMFEDNAAFQDELRSYFGEQLAKPTVSLFYAKQDGKIVGTIGIRPMDDATTAEIWGFYVAKDFHGTGVAQKLYEQVLLTDQANSAERLQLSVAKDAERAQAFYLKKGFTVMHEEDWDWPHWTDEHPHNQYLVMQKDLRL